jgi:hypothetical protein
VPADDAIGQDGPKAREALRALRTPIVKRLREMEAALAEHAAKQKSK